MASLNYAKFLHSSCALGDYVYVMCYSSYNTIERLDMTKERSEAKWQVVDTLSKTLFSDMS